MFCPKCGKAAAADSAFCVYCGQSLTKDLSLKPSTGDSLFELSEKTNFLVITVMLSVSFALSFIMGSINIALGLTVLSLWFLFGAAKAKKECLKGAAIRISVITAKIQYILVFVLSGLIAFVGICFLVIFITEGDGLAVLGDSFTESSNSLLVTLGKSSYDLSSYVGSDEGILVGIALMIAMFAIAIAAIILNLIFRRYFLYYFSAIDNGLKGGTPVKLYDNSLSKRLLAFGIIGAVGFVVNLVSAVIDPSFTSIVAIMSSGVLTFAYFLASSFIKEKKNI